MPIQDPGSINLPAKRAEDPHDLTEEFSQTRKEQIKRCLHKKELLGSVDVKFRSRGGRRVSRLPSVVNKCLEGQPPCGLRWSRLEPAGPLEARTAPAHLLHDKLWPPELPFRLSSSREARTTLAPGGTPSPPPSSDMPESRWGPEPSHCQGAGGWKRCHLSFRATREPQRKSAGKNAGSCPHQVSTARGGRPEWPTEMAVAARTRSPRAHL